MNHQTMNACDNQQKLIASIMLLVVSITFIKLLLQSGSRGKRLPPTVSAVPLVGGLIRFMRGPIPMIREEYARLGSVFTVDILSRKITFLIGPEVSEHFFSGYESELSQQEVYRLTVPSFGRGVVYDVDYSVRLEQFRFFAESLHSNKLRGYVSQMVFETEVRITSSVLDLCSC
jgi:sterol 14-demethylase